MWRLRLNELNSVVAIAWKAFCVPKWELTKAVIGGGFRRRQGFGREEADRYAKFCAGGKRIPQFFLIWEGNRPALTRVPWSTNAQIRDVTIPLSIFEAARFFNFQSPKNG